MINCYVTSALNAGCTDEGNTPIEVVLHKNEENTMNRICDQWGSFKEMGKKWNMYLKLSRVSWRQLGEFSLRGHSERQEEISK